jgi:hypothetical protein
VPLRDAPATTVVSITNDQPEATAASAQEKMNVRQADQLSEFVPEGWEVALLGWVRPTDPQARPGVP